MRNKRGQNGQYMSTSSVTSHPTWYSRDARSQKPFNVETGNEGADLRLCGPHDVKSSTQSLAKCYTAAHGFHGPEENGGRAWMI